VLALLRGCERRLNGLGHQVLTSRQHQTLLGTLPHDQQLLRDLIITQVRDLVRYLGSLLIGLAALVRVIVSW